MTVNIFETGFNPASFLYLNPFLSNVTTIEEALILNASGQLNGLWSNFDKIPSGLDPDIFLSDNKNFIDISNLNNLIKESIILDGGDIEQCANYYPTIFRSMVYIGSNTFQLNNSGDDPFNISNSNLNLGDQVKILNKNGLNIYGTVTSIDDNQTFSIETKANIKNQSGFSWILYGIKLFDAMRLSRISYLELYKKNNYQTINSLVDIDSNFNFDLYKILYPDARDMSIDDAYADFNNRLGNNDYRIGTVKDFNNYRINQSIDELTINQTLKLNFGQETGRVNWNGQDVYYVTDEVNRPLDNISPYFPGLITEYAMKSYLYNMFYPLATFCNVIIKENLWSKKTYTSNLYVESNAIIDGDLLGNRGSFSSNVTGLRFGIGPFSGVAIPPSLTRNIVCDTIQCEGSVTIGNTSTISQNILNVQGIITATNFNNVSDYRVKRNIKDADNEPKFSRIVEYNLHSNNTKKLGFIAQELEEMFPEAVQIVKNYILDFENPFDAIIIDKLKIELFENYKLSQGDILKTTLGEQIIIDRVEGKYIYVKELFKSAQTLQITSIVYNNIKMIDYNQVLMALVLKVNKLTNCHCLH